MLKDAASIHSAQREVSGHDFSRAANAAKSTRASAPEDQFSGSSQVFNEFLIPQLQIVFAEGAGGFSPLKSCRNNGAFRPGTGRSEANTTTVVQNNPAVGA